MIVGVLNGYYRSVTTFFQKIVHDFNPDVIDLHEPTSPIILEEIERYRGEETHPLHGWNVFDGFYRLDRDTFEKFKKVHKRVMKKPENACGVVMNRKDAMKLLEPFHESEEKIFIKSNQLHFHLQTIKEEFSIPVIHISRDVAEIVFSHVPRRIRNTPALLNRWLENYDPGNHFFLNTIHEELSRKSLAYTDEIAAGPRIVSNVLRCEKVVSHQDVIRVRAEVPIEVLRALWINCPLKIPLSIKRKEYFERAIKAPLHVKRYVAKIVDDFAF